MRRTLVSSAVLLALTATAAAEAPVLSCRGAQHPALIAELLFGRDIGHRLGVTGAAWSRFLAREITPRFPDGLTVSDAIGQWRDPRTGRIVREPSKRVEIVLPGRADDAARLDAIGAAYKRRFRQHSVGIVVQAGCVLF